MKTYVLDTSFVLAILNPNDPAYGKAKDLLFSIVEDEVRLEIPVICAAESIIKCHNAISYIDLLTELINKKDFESLLPTDVRFIAKMEAKVRAKLKANDCSVLAITKRLGGKLITLDKNLNRLATLLLR